MRRLACSDYGFESHGGHECFECCQVEVSAMNRSLVQSSPVDCGVSLCVIYKRHESGGPGPLWAVAPKDKQKNGKE